MKYRLLAFDLDGTLTNSQKIVTPKTKEILYEARRQGVTIALASGRPVHGIEPIARDLELERFGGFILACNGSLIYDCKQKKTILETSLPRDVVKPICDYANEKGYSILTYSEDGHTLYTNQVNRYVEIEARINHLPMKEIYNLGTFITYPIPKLLITEDPETVEAEMPVLRSMVPGLNVFTSAPFFMEIVPKGIDKFESLAKLCSYVGCTTEELAAFGDGGNDITMIAKSGLGVAMANASDAVKEVADYVTFDNDSDGCAHAIEQMLQDLL